ncbi:hypothetical protein E4U41_004654, partial [Claviceps citrina]
MALLGISLIVASVVYLFFRRPPAWLAQRLPLPPWPGTETRRGRAVTAAATTTSGASSAAEKARHDGVKQAPAPAPGTRGVDSPRGMEADKTTTPDCDGCNGSVEVASTTTTTTTTTTRSTAAGDAAAAAASTTPAMPPTIQPLPDSPTTPRATAATRLQT